MEKITVQKGKFVISNDPKAEIATEFLGASLAIVIYDKVEKTGGILVCIIPKSLMVVMGNDINVRHGLDTGLPSFFKGFLPLSKKENLDIYIIGAGTFMTSPPLFDIGDQLYRTATHILSKNKFDIKHEHIKWQMNRSAVLNIETGEVKVKLTDGQEIKL